MTLHYYLLTATGWVYDSTVAGANCLSQGRQLMALWDGLFSFHCTLGL